MGFRSVFVTESAHYQWPDWFVKKYHETVNITEHCLTSKLEHKTYTVWSHLDLDIQKAIDWDKKKNVVVVYLHECGGITRCHITKDRIIYTEPSGWEVTEEITHDYCYGCSDPSTNTATAEVV